MPLAAPDETTVRLPLRQAAEQMGLSAAALLKRIQRGKADAERDNQGHWRVLVDPNAPKPKPRTSPKVRAARLQERVAELEKALSEASAAVTSLSASTASMSTTIADQQRALTDAMSALDRAKADLFQAQAEATRLQARGLWARVLNR